MNAKKIELNEINRKLYKYFKEIRVYFYNLFYNSTQNEKKSDFKNPEYVEGVLKNYQDLISNMKTYLTYFNGNRKITCYISEKFINELINAIKENFNFNYNICDIESIYKSIIIQSNFIFIKFSYFSNIEILKDINCENSFNKGTKALLISNSQQFEEKKIQNYIEEKKYKMISFNKRNEIKHLKDNEIIIVKLFELELLNFVISFTIEEKENESNSVLISNTNIQGKYISLHNTLLMKKIKEEILDIIEFFFQLTKAKENNAINFFEIFIDYIHDYDKIFKIKCFKCKKNSKYSHFEKAFFPPFIKFNLEKLNNNNLKYINRSNEELFFHPQCCK